MSKTRLAVAVCRKCSAIGYGPARTCPGGFVPVPKKAPLGLRVQAAGARISLFSGGASKGGYAMQAAANQRTGVACETCGSDKVILSESKMSLARAKELLGSR